MDQQKTQKITTLENNTHTQSSQELSFLSPPHHLHHSMTFYNRGAMNKALALPAHPPFDKGEEVLGGTAGEEGGGSLTNRPGTKQGYSGCHDQVSQQVIHNVSISVDYFLFAIAAAKHHCPQSVPAVATCGTPFFILLSFIINKGRRGRIHCPVRYRFSSLVALAVLSFFQCIPSPSDIQYDQFTSVPAIFKMSGAEVDHGERFPHGITKGEDLQIEGQGSGGSNQTKTKVRAVHDYRRGSRLTPCSATFSPQEVALDQHPTNLGE
jgi:hypothetical protein